MSSKSFGSEGFLWWFGKVEDRNDPEQLGRVRVRVFSYHPDSAALPTDSLPWAPVMMPVTSASQAGVGISPTGLQVGSIVWGYFLDGIECQFPMVCAVHVGITNGVHDVSALARGTQTLSKTPLGPEPDSAFHAKYPYNHVYRSESGHVIEVDDTPNYERLHTYHRSGTYQEIDFEGRRVNKIIGDDFEIIERNKTVYVQGNVTLVVKGNVDATIYGNLKTSVQGDVTMSTQGNFNLTAAGNITMLAGGNLALSAAGEATYTIEGSFGIEATGQVTINGSTVNLN